MTKNPVTCVTSVYKDNGTRFVLCIQRKNGRAKYYKSTEARYYALLSAGVKDFHRYIHSRSIVFRRPA